MTTDNDDDDDYDDDNDNDDDVEERGLWMIEDQYLIDQIYPTCLV